nr:MAG TPA: hypothetical protein [Caudoviricetes sp.]
MEERPGYKAKAACFMQAAFCFALFLLRIA